MSRPEIDLNNVDHQLLMAAIFSLCEQGKHPNEIMPLLKEMVTQCWFSVIQEGKE